MRIVVGMQVDESRGHNQAARVDRLFGFVGRESPDLGDASIFDSDVAADTRGPGPIDNHSVFNDNVEFWHQPISALGLGFRYSPSFALNGERIKSHAYRASVWQIAAGPAGNRSSMNAYCPDTSGSNAFPRARAEISSCGRRVPARRRSGPDPHDHVVEGDILHEFHQAARVEKLLQRVQGRVGDRMLLVASTA